MTDRTPIERLPRIWHESSPWWPLYQDFRRIAKKHIEDRGDADTSEDAVDRFICRDGFHVLGKMRKLCFRDIETRKLI